MTNTTPPQPVTFEQWRDRQGFPVTSTQEPLWRKCWSAAQTAAQGQEAAKLARMATAAEAVASRLEAWAEYHESRARATTHREAAADRNTAANYRALIELLRGALTEEAPPCP